jgi:hypothetical protein
LVLGRDICREMVGLGNLFGGIGGIESREWEDPIGGAKLWR